MDRQGRRAWMARFLSLALTVEKRVQAAADSERLNSYDRSDQQRILGLIAIEAAGTGDPDVTPDLASKLGTYVARSMLGKGPLEPLLSDGLVEEVLVNAPDRIFVHRAGASNLEVFDAFYDADHVNRIVERLADSALGASRSLDPAEGIQDFNLPGGVRMHLVHPELSPSSHLIVNIRKPRKSGLSSHLGEGERLLSRALACGASILIAGLPGSGKTTLVRRLLAAMPGSTRVVIAEEVGETVVEMPNAAHLQTRRGRAGAEGIDLRKLVNAFLRMSPDVAVVGEIRDAEALPFIIATTSGITGVSTIHARDARGALSRLRALGRLAEGNLGDDLLTSLISEGIDLVAYVSRSGGDFHIDSIIAVEDAIATPHGYSFVTTGAQLLAGVPQFPVTTRLLQRFPGVEEAVADSRNAG